jgi:hypothetical protein
VGENYALRVLYQPTNALPSPTSWRVVGGPAWLSLRKLAEHEVELSGTPTAVATLNLTVEVSVGACVRNIQIPLQIFPRLQSRITNYITGTSTTRVAVPGTTLDGGKGPYRCTFYTQTGRGILPSFMYQGGNFGIVGVTLDATDTTNCTLLGQPSQQTNEPGTYGFIMIVEDALGQRIEIPIVYNNGSCNTAPINNGMLEIQPAAEVATVPVKTAGSSYQYNLAYKGGSVHATRLIGQTPNPNGTLSCFYSVELSLFPDPLTGLTLPGGGMDLVCTTNSPAPVCLDCPVGCADCNRGFCRGGFTASLPNCTSPPAQVTQDLRTRSHAPIRPAGSSAFQFFMLQYQSSVYDTAGNPIPIRVDNVARCVITVLEK